jgi:hypothetical protein
MGRFFVTAVVVLLACTGALPGMANEMAEPEIQVSQLNGDCERSLLGAVKIFGHELADLKWQEAGGLFTEELKALNAAALPEDEISRLSAVETLKITGAYYSFNNEFSRARAYFSLTLELLKAESEIEQVGSVQEDVKVCTNMIDYLDRMIAK